MKKKEKKQPRKLGDILSEMDIAKKVNSIISKCPQQPKQGLHCPLLPIKSPLSYEW